MKKFMKGLAAIGLAVTMCVPFAACGNNTPKTEQRKVYEAYVAYAEASGDTVLSYEEWLETVKGPKATTVTTPTTLIPATKFPMSTMVSTAPKDPKATRVIPARKDPKVTRVIPANKDPKATRVIPANKDPKATPEPQVRTEPTEKTALMASTEKTAHKEIKEIREIKVIKVIKAMTARSVVSDLWYARSKNSTSSQKSTIRT